MQSSLEKWVWGRDLKKANPIKASDVAWKGLISGCWWGNWGGLVNDGAGGHQLDYLH